MLDEVTVIMSRLNDMLQEIGGIGRNEDGSITRLGASEGYFQALEQVKMRMEALGMKAEQDPVGNLHGILPVSYTHLDTHSLAGIYRRGGHYFGRDGGCSPQYDYAYRQDAGREI